MKKIKKNPRKPLGILLAVLLLCLSVSVPARAVGLISGRYLSRTATELTLEIKIGSPPPASLIIIQHLPPGTAPASANPPYKKYNAKKGEVRWLLRNVQAGTITVHLKLKAPVKPNQVSAEIRCKNPSTGKLVTTQVK